MRWFTSQPFWIRILIGLLVAVLVTEGGLVTYRFFNPIQPMITDTENLPVYTLEQLKQYDGSDPAKPIYIGLDGYVYDVTAGKKFYASGGAYHSLAGKDASNELRIFGGDTIKQKYPVVGKMGN